MTHSNNHLYKYTMSSLSIHLSMDIGCFHVLAIVNSAVVNTVGHESFRIMVYLYNGILFSHRKE